VNDISASRRPFTILSLLKPVERANRAFWHAVLARMWPNERLATRLDPSTVKRVLFLRYDNIGDMLTTLPAIRLMKRLNPAMEIDVLASKSNGAIVAHDPNVTRVLTLRHRPDLFLRDIAAARRIGYDVVVCCIFAKATKVGIIANWIAGASAVKATIWRGAKYHRFFNVQSREAASQATMWDKMLHLVPDIFDYELEPGDEAPYVAIDDASRQAAHRRLEELAIPQHGFVLMNLTSMQVRNRWTEEGFTALADAITRAEPDNRIVITSMGNDRLLAERIVAALPEAARPRVAIYPATRNVLEIVALVEASEAVFTLDTGVVHMASATHRPTLALYVKSEHSPAEWRPYGVLHRVVCTSVAHEPVATIPVEPVVREILALLADVRSGTPTELAETGGLAVDYERYYQERDEDEIAPAQ
jgi:ADP-heptose:LPS heptosyltransferase